MSAFPAMPEIGAPTRWAPPLPWEGVLGCGARLIVLPMPSLPLVSMRMLIHGGARLDPPGGAGLATFTDELVLHGAGDRDALAFAGALEQAGIHLEADTGSEDSALSLDARSEQLDLALDLLADAILRPRFASREASRVAELQAGDIAMAIDDPNEQARLAVRAAWYGRRHPLGRPVEGTLASVERLHAPGARRDWARRYRADRATFVLAGDVQIPALQAALEARFEGWARSDAPLVPTPRAPARPRPRPVHVEAPEASQTVLHFALPGWATSDPDFVAGRLAVSLFGGTFTSRLNRLLREERGLTYGISAWVDSGPTHGLVHIRTSVQANQAAEAEAAIHEELARLAHGVEAHEIEKAVAVWRTSMLEAMGTRSGVAGSFASLVAQGVGVEALGGRLAQAEEIKREAVSKCAAALSRARPLVVSVGP